MGIESDRMVFDYLSEVGDLAQQRQLPPGDRSALVAGLRDEIDRRRATYGEESPSAVRGILGDLGTPDEVVARAKDGDGGGRRGTPPAPARPPAPGPKRGAWWSDTDTATGAGAGTSRTSSTGTGSSSTGTGRTSSTGTGSSSTGTGSSSSTGTGTESPLRKEPAPVPHPRGWWHGEPVEPGGDLDPMVPGFVGGVEAWELFRPPEPEAPEEDEPEEAPAPVGRARRLARILRRRRPEPEAAEEEPEEEAAAPARRGVAHPFLLLAALLLVAGAAFGWLLALAGGWLIAYGSRRLTPGQVKTAVLVLPGLAAAGSAAWLWGRRDGRWGDPLPPEALSAALADTWPWTLRAAALLSALYLVHRARRG
ncbi:hypothetical protein [Streptomyces sp. NRRL F-5727]|uniref:hypothetical protein n=1 Tax=Streptomyces sp. NRRL F-5727 TaxID=1463871 RepID=UPI0004CA3263|nr:hypothetical protein [Streptomyces sp. NRRL F-5727]